MRLLVAQLPFALTALALTALALMVLALTGCGVGAGRAPTGVQLLVSRDFGASVLRATSAPEVRGEESVMSMLMRNYAVRARYSGGFVESIDGLAGGSEGGHPVDWFYYVNGVQAPIGAASTNVHPGDRIWWDRHDWSQTEQVPAVVGSFPEPFLNGLEGKRLPVRIECAEVQGAACSTVGERLRAAGVPAAIAAAGVAAGPKTLRVLVGPWSAVSVDPSAQTLMGGPRTSGVYATFAPGGRSLTVLDADGRAVSTLRAGSGLIAATRREQAAPVWLVTGTDERGVERAARSFDRAALAHRFAVAVDAQGALPVPAPGG